MHSPRSTQALQDHGHTLTTGRAHRLQPDLAVGPLTHTVSYAGNRFKVVHQQAAGITKAMMDARLGLNTFLGLPVTDAGTSAASAAPPPG